VERGRWEGQNFQLGSSAPERRRRRHFISTVVFSNWNASDDIMSGFDVVYQWNNNTAMLGISKTKGKTQLLWLSKYLPILCTSAITSRKFRWCTATTYWSNYGTNIQTRDNVISKVNNLIWVTVFGIKKNCNRSERNHLEYQFRTCDRT